MIEGEKGAIGVLGEKIKRLRMERGLSQEELAGRLAVVRQTVSKWEKELSLPDSEMLVKLAEVFEISAAELLGEEQMEAPSEEAERKPSRLKGWEIALLILGAPLWLPLGIAVAAVAIALYAVVWSMVISLWSVFASLVGCAFGGAVACVVFMVGGSGASGLAMLAAGFVCAGLSIFLFYGCKAATKGILILTKKIAIGIKDSFRRKEAAQ